MVFVSKTVMDCSIKEDNFTSHYPCEALFHYAVPHGACICHSPGRCRAGIKSSGSFDLFQLFNNSSGVFSEDNAGPSTTNLHMKRFTGNIMQSTMFNVGMLFLSHTAHIHHAAPIAFELSMDPRFKVTIFVSSEDNRELIEDLAAWYPGHRCTTVFLKPSLGYRITKAYKKKAFPRVSHILKHHYQRFAAQDIIISPHDNVTYLMERNGTKRTTYITTLHGMEDGERFNKRQTRYRGFDYLLVPGPYRWDYLKKQGLIHDHNATMIGYPKFDITLKKGATRLNLFSENRPVVLYNPHYDRHLSSWPAWGKKLLDFFAQSRDYNLIFAPHVKLFTKKSSKELGKYQALPHIHVDVDSFNLVDMSYVPLTDIYIGDVSSQVFEYIYSPRPCLFLNPGNVNWKHRNGFAMWAMGDVVTTLDHFEAALQNTRKNHRMYGERQQTFIESRISPSDIPAGKRGAQAIIDYMTESGPGIKTQ